MRKHTATLDISFQATDEDVIEHFKWRKKEITEVTQKHIEEYFRDMLDDYAGSNDGSELLANADFTIESTEIY